MEIDPTSAIQEMVEQCMYTFLLGDENHTFIFHLSSRFKRDDGLNDARSGIRYSRCR
jgi:hypothetical protein